MFLQRRSKKRNAIEWIIPAIIVFFYANTFYFGKTLSKDGKIDNSYNLEEGGARPRLQVAPEEGSLQKVNETNTHYIGGSDRAADEGEARAPLHWNSGWIGNQWVPPNGYKLYSAVDMRNYFSNHSIIFIGDSTARRQYATFFATVAAPKISDITLAQLDAASVIDVNKGTITENSTREGYNIIFFVSCLLVIMMEGIMMSSLRIIVAFVRVRVYVDWSKTKKFDFFKLSYSS